MPEGASGRKTGGLLTHLVAASFQNLPWVSLKCLYNAYSFGSGHGMGAVFLLRKPHSGPR